MVLEAIKLYQQRQEAVCKPVNPREPLKRTVGNNWVHVNCAVWNPEIKFGIAEELEPAEGFGLIPRDRYRETCKLCQTTNGACVSCHFPGCNAKFHVGCALRAEYTFGFDVMPVKGSRRDSTVTMKMGGEVGSVVPSIWCPTHVIPTIVHEISEATEEGQTALELYVRSYKQADLSLTGTVRKAAHALQHIHPTSNGPAHANRRASTINTVASERASSAATIPDDHTPTSASTEPRLQFEGKTCIHCQTHCSPRWWRADFPPLKGTMLTNGMSHLMNGGPMQSHSVSGYMNGDYMRQNEAVFECHKCHIKKPTPQASPETRPAAFTAQPSLTPIQPTLRPAEYTPFTSHGHPGPQNVLPGRPHPGYHAPATAPGPTPPTPSGPEWHSSYDKHRQANGFGSFAGSLPHLNGYGAAPVSGSHSHGPGAGPGPRSLVPSPHQHYGGLPSTLPPPPPPPPHSYVSPSFGPPTMPSPHAPPARPFGTSMSPPELHASIVRHSPPHALSVGAPAQRARLFSVDRVGQSPSMSKVGLDGPLPGLQSVADERPPSSGRYPGAGPGPGPSGTSGTTGSSGASASPSLKNLLS